MLRFSPTGVALTKAYSLGVSNTSIYLHCSDPKSHATTHVIVFDNDRIESITVTRNIVNVDAREKGASVVILNHGKDHHCDLFYSFTLGSGGNQNVKVEGQIDPEIFARLLTLCKALTSLPQEGIDKCRADLNTMLEKNYQTLIQKFSTLEEFSVGGKKIPMQLLKGLVQMYEESFKAFVNIPKETPSLRQG